MGSPLGLAAARGAAASAGIGLLRTKASRKAGPESLRKPCLCLVICASIRRAACEGMEEPMAIAFDEYQLDPRRRELRRGPNPVVVEPQVFDLLAYLIEHRDRVVGKDELISTVWAGRIVSDSALASRINAARKAIGDSGEGQRLIRTYHRKGVRFIGEVREVESAAAAEPVT